MKKSALIFLISFLIVGFTSMSFANERDKAELNAEYQKRAIVAADAVYHLNWGISTGEAFAIEYRLIFENFRSADGQGSGEYQFRLMRQDSGGNWVERGMDIKVEIENGKIMNVSVYCFFCD